jgi:diaminopimelate epimerase
MNIQFYKYQGAGNDFIIIDGQEINPFQKHPDPTSLVSLLCDRRFGVGADGLMVLIQHPEYDFQMIYYNSDGNISSFCGNGGRCIVAFANHIRIIDTKTSFLAADGIHKATILEINGNQYQVSLSMNDVSEVKEIGEDLFLNTGSPHLVKFVDDPEMVDVFQMGRMIRYSEPFKEKGTNVNFAAVKENQVHVRTYERGVENETLACGTGITATAIASYIRGFRPENNNFRVKAKGGDLSVQFSTRAGESFHEILLEGPATMVFQGNIYL